MTLSHFNLGVAFVIEKKKTWKDLENMKDIILKRTLKFSKEVGVPFAAFAKNVNLSASTLYKWKAGFIDISPAALKRIDVYLERFGY